MHRLDASKKRPVDAVGGDPHADAPDGVDAQPGDDGADRTSDVEFAEKRAKPEALSPAPPPACRIADASSLLEPRPWAVLAVDVETHGWLEPLPDACKKHRGQFGKLAASSLLT